MLLFCIYEHPVVNGLFIYLDHSEKEKIFKNDKRFRKAINMSYSLGIWIYINPNGKHTVNHRLKLLLKMYDARGCDHILKTKEK